MDLNAKYRQQFYQEQNIQLRKQIREVDLLLAQSYKKEEESSSNSCVFLVLGCPSSGKTSLLQTLQFALNGSQGWGRTKRGVVTSYQIKRGSRWQVQGVKELKQTQRKYSILGLQLNANEKPCNRYKLALEYVDSGFEGCLQKGCQTMNKSLAKVCLVCIDVSVDVGYEEMTYIRFLRVDLNQRHIKTIFILTKADKQAIYQSQKCLWLQKKINKLMKDLDIKDRDDIIVFENYVFPQPTQNSSKLALTSSQTHKVQSNQELNYYSLRLLIRLIHQCEKITKSYNKTAKSWICGWA